MADDNAIVAEPQIQTQPDRTQLLPEIKEMLDMRLGLSKPIAPVPPAQQTAQPAQTAAAPADGLPAQPATTTQPSTQDYWEPIKTKFNYQNSEDAIKEIESLRALKDAPPVYEFENEISKNIFEGLVKGDTKPLYQYLSEQQKLDDVLSAPVTPEIAPEIVKTAMGVKYQTLSPKEIDFQFNKRFGVPPKPVQTDVEDETEYQARVDRWNADVQDKQMELMIEAKMVRPELETRKNSLSLKLPEIDQPADEGYTQYKQMLEQEANNSAEATAAYKAFTPDTIQTKINYKDEQNKIDFDFEFKPDAQSFEQARTMASDLQSFWNYFYNQDGSPNREKFLKSVYIAVNADKIILEAIKQGKNAALKANLPDNRKSQGMVRELGTLDAGQESELDKNMRRQGLTRTV